MDLKALLEELGYDVRDFGHYWTCQALYRDGQDPSSVVIYPDSNVVIDYVSAERFSLQHLIARTIGAASDEEAEKFLTQKSCFVISKTHFNPKILVCQTYDSACLSKLVPDHSYWASRGISDKTMTEFRGGVCNLGRFKNRYVFPIFRKEFGREDIIGFSARSLNKLENKRWLHHGSKSFWIYPTFLNESILKRSSEVILVEGMGDCLTLWELGIKNVIVVFGIEMCKSILIYLLKHGIKNVVISFNNDKKNNAGQTGAEKLTKRLENYFDRSRIRTVFPENEKDWNDVLLKEGPDAILKQFGKLNEISTR